MIQSIWHRLFLQERPSLSLGLFRVATALSVGLHVIPTLMNLPDNYLHTAFKTVNPQFFTAEVLNWVAKSPDWLVLVMTASFYVTWFCFLVGLGTQVSGILMTVTCYYFYALNSFHVGTLSWDILLVTVVMMCVTNYPGDFLSLDAVIRKDILSYKKSRPFFVQRLLQMQLASTFFYTALYKTTGAGNWLKENPLYFLMNYPPEGVMKWSMLKDFLADKPNLCYGLGLAVVITEFTLPFLLFVRPTRVYAIVAGISFHVVLLLTMDVPAIFFWLFPAMFLLFISPELMTGAIDYRRQRNRKAGRDRLFYDGDCVFCRGSVARVQVMDLFGRVEAVNYHSLEDPAAVDSSFTKEKLHKEMHLLEDTGRVNAGFFAFRRMACKLPLLFPLIPLLFLPGMSVLGPAVYTFIARNRYFFNPKMKCDNQACYR